MRCPHCARDHDEALARLSGEQFYCTGCATWLVVVAQRRRAYLATLGKPAPLFPVADARALSDRIARRGARLGRRR